MQTQEENEEYKTVTGALGEKGGRQHSAEFPQNIKYFEAVQTQVLSDDYFILINLAQNTEFYLIFSHCVVKFVQKTINPTYFVTYCNF